MARHAVPPAMQERRYCAKYEMISNLNGALKIGNNFGFDLRPSCAKERNTNEIMKKWR